MKKRLMSLLHIGGSDDTSKENSDEEAEKKEDDLSDLNDAIEVGRSLCLCCFSYRLCQ